MDFFIKNMVCDRCIMVVKDDFEISGLSVAHITLGKVITSDPITEEQRQAVKARLEIHGFELLKGEDEILSDTLKTEMLLFISNGNLHNEKLSEYLSNSLHKDYGVLSKLFSRFNNITIEKYFIKLKIEKARQYIHENVLNFSEIADKLGYNSLSHLSTQFRKETGYSLSEYKQLPAPHRNGLDKIL